MKRILSAIVTAGILGIGLGFASEAHASTLVTPPLGTPTFYTGNDCAGVFGRPFEECKDPRTGSRVIAKLGFDGETPTQYNKTYFSSLDGDEFSVQFYTDLTFTTTTNNNTGIGIWTYNPGIGDPVVTSVAAKAGNGFNLFDNLNGALSGKFVTPDQKALSHITFYDTINGKDVPEPSLLLGIGAVVGSSFLLRRRKSS